MLKESRLRGNGFNPSSHLDQRLEPTHTVFFPLFTGLGDTTHNGYTVTSSQVSHEIESKDRRND